MNQRFPGKMTVRALLVSSLLFIAPHLGFCVSTPDDTLKIYIVSEEPVAGGKFIDTADCPKVGYVSNTPSLIITHLQSVSTNMATTGVIKNGKVLPDTNLVINVKMYGSDAAQFAELTRQNIGHRTLLTLGERPLMAPRIKSPIESGEFELTVRPDKTEAMRADLKKLVR